MGRSELWIVVVLLVGLAACAPAVPTRVETLPAQCRAGARVILGRRCESRCTCRGGGKWSCVSQPCARYEPPPPPPPPARKPDAGITVDAQRRRSDASSQPVADTRPSPSQGGDQGSGSVRVEGPYRRTFAADGSLLSQEFYHLGRPALRCTPTTSSGELRCVLSYPQGGGLALDPSCWKRARLPPTGAQGIATRAAFERIFRCRTPPRIDWKRARLVLVQARVASFEKLEVLVFQRRGTTELVAEIRRRCYGVRLPDHERTVDRRELHLVPREGRLSARVERSVASCGPVP